jgi:CubicO group peptidase (beta-lactamase class C family)
LSVGDLRLGRADLTRLQAGLDGVLNGSFPGVHSLLLIHHGKLVLEEYFYGYGSTDAHPLYSATKSIFSALFGIAQGQGLVKLNQKLYDFYPEARSQPAWDSRKDAITLGMLLGMNAGFQCDDMANCHRDVFRAPDAVQAALALPLDHDPGSHWTYNGTSLLPVSAVIEKKSGLSIANYAQRYLEGPLGIAPHPWAQDRHGATAVDTGHSLTPREMAKFGLMMLNKGVWKGKQIVPETWVQAVSQKQAPDFDYGYLFWLKTAWFGEKPYPIVEANGFGGQYIFIVPDADAVGVMTAGNYQMGEAFAAEEDLFESYVLRAVAQ